MTLTRYKIVNRLGGIAGFSQEEVRPSAHILGRTRETLKTDRKSDNMY